MGNQIANLVNSDRVVMRDLEAILGKSIPPSPYPIDFGFRMKKGHITMLALANCDLTALPESISNLKYLKNLDLSLNKLDALPQWIGKLIALEELELQFNQLRTIPNEICQLVHLSSLDLSNNQIDALPDSIGALKSLRELFLHENKLSTLPASVWNLPLLETLELSDNNFSSLPNDIKHLKSLDILEIQGNHFQSLPDALLLVPMLRILRIDSSLETCTLIHELKKKKVGISVRKPSEFEKEMEVLQTHPLITQEKILSKLSSEPIHIQELISRLEIKKMDVARSLQIELKKLEASKKILVFQKEERNFYSLKESINHD